MRRRRRNWGIGGPIFFILFECAVVVESNMAEGNYYEECICMDGVRSLKDKRWIGMIIYMGCDMPLYAFALFLPTIISELGYKTTKAQLLTVPPYAAAAILVGFILYPN